MSRPFVRLLFPIAGLAFAIPPSHGAEASGPRTLENLLDTDTPSSPPMETPKELRAGAKTDGPVPADPGNLIAYRSRIGNQLSFRVVADTKGPLWGGQNNIYTDDSRLATAVVHAGILLPGQEGIVTVMIRPGEESYEGSARNGVSSGSWKRYWGSYQILKNNAAVPTSVTKVLDDAVAALRRSRKPYEESSTRILNDTEDKLAEEVYRLTKAGRLDEARVTSDLILTFRGTLLARAADASGQTLRRMAGKWNRPNIDLYWVILENGTAGARRIADHAPAHPDSIARVIADDAVEISWPTGLKWRLRLAGPDMLAVQEVKADGTLLGDGVVLTRAK